jgi:L-ascorbate metabolism protein UlaG (beta-lactamase superfamily)
VYPSRLNLPAKVRLFVDAMGTLAEPMLPLHSGSAGGGTVISRVPCFAAMRRAHLLPTLLLASMTAVLLAATPESPPRVEITYLGNEGVLIAVGAHQVAIDALHREFPREPYYEHLSQPHLEKLETAATPFDRIRVHLTTHAHADHFHGESVSRFLGGSRHGEVVVPREALSELCRGPAAEPCSASPRLHVHKEDWGAEKELVFGDIRVTVLELPHARGARTRVTNLGYLVSMGGKRFLHVGDADMSAESFARFRLPARKIDVAFIPYWYLQSEEGRRLVREHIGAAQLVAFHVPPSEHTRVAKQVRAHFPDALVLTQMMRTDRL